MFPASSVNVSWPPVQSALFGSIVQTLEVVQLLKLVSNSFCPALALEAVRATNPAATNKSPAVIDGTRWCPRFADEARLCGVMLRDYRALSGDPPPRWEPASTIKISPVTRSAPSRNHTAAWAMSSGVPAFLSGVTRSCRASAAS
jgi:hypothetical protein